jgi:outer membrane protein OmpA-like peptidoglycan-associated protein
MKPKYLEPAANQRDRWTISYVDVLTILLVFFIVAAAKTLPVQAETPPPPPPPPAKIEAPKSPLADAQDKLKALGFEAILEPRGLVISLPQAILFAAGDDRVSREAIPVIADVAKVLGTLPNQVSLIGHADATPIHNQRFKNNWELSAARGLRLLELLTNTYNIPESRLSVSSDGANRPLSSNETAEGRASNRRVEILILNQEPMASH